MSEKQPYRVDAARVARLRQQIEDAFADVPYPGDDNIAYDPEDWEASEMADKARGKHWRELDPLFLDVESPSFMTPEAMQFYFPAYLLDAIDRDFAGAQSFTFHLKPDEPKDPDSAAATVRIYHYDVLTPEQRDAVRAFIECYRDWLEDNRWGLSDELVKRWLQELDTALAQIWGPEGLLGRPNVP